MWNVSEVLINLGPLFTYMAKCDPDCGSFTGTKGPVWFKIGMCSLSMNYTRNLRLTLCAEDEMGYNNVTNSWATQKMFDDGNTWTSIVPACLTPGQYLVRHEIIALSDAYKVGGCQFYVRIPVFWSGNGSLVCCAHIYPIA